MSSPRMRSSAEQGFTFLEVLLALSLLGAGAYLMVEGIGHLSSLSRDTHVLSSLERQINTIADNIRIGLGSYQINYDYSPAARNEALKVEKLPMAWDIGRIGPKNSDACRGCRGTYGFVIQPLENYRGLYLVTLRMTYKEWLDTEGNLAPRDFEFLVAIK